MPHDAEAQAVRRFYTRAGLMGSDDEAEIPKLTPKYHYLRCIKDVLERNEARSAESALIEARHSRERQKFDTPMAKLAATAQEGPTPDTRVRRSSLSREMHKFDTQIAKLAATFQKGPTPDTRLPLNQIGFHSANRAGTGVDPIHVQKLALEITLQGYSQNKLENRMGFEPGKPGGNHALAGDDLSSLD